MNLSPGKQCNTARSEITLTYWKLELPRHRRRLPFRYGGGDGRPGNLFRGNGYFRVLTHGIARARNRTSDDDFKIHVYNSEYLARSWVGLILKYS